MDRSFATEISSYDANLCAPKAQVSTAHRRLFGHAGPANWRSGFALYSLGASPLSRASTIPQPRAVGAGSSSSPGCGADPLRGRGLLGRPVLHAGQAATWANEFGAPRVQHDPVVPGQACMGSLTWTVVMVPPLWTNVMGLGDQAPPTTYRVVPVGLSTRADASWEPDPCSADHQVSCRPACAGVPVLSSGRRHVLLAGRRVQASRGRHPVGGLRVLLHHLDS